ncbi:hypothetical protein FKM82_022237 [Ascaphus truei]
MGKGGGYRSGVSRCEMGGGYTRPLTQGRGPFITLVLGPGKSVYSPGYNTYQHQIGIFCVACTSLGCSPCHAALCTFTIPKHFYFKCSSVITATLNPTVTRDYLCICPFLLIKTY